MAWMVATHAVLFLVAWFVSFCTRWDFQPDARMLGMFRGTVVWVVVVKTIVFLLHGEFRWLFGRLSFADLGRLAFTTTLATLALVAIDVVRDSVGDLPGLRQRLSRSVLVIDWAATMFLIGGLRALPRTIREVFRPWVTSGDVRSALIVGATETGELLARNLVANQSPSYIVVGFLDDNALLRGSRIAGIRVLGGVGDALKVLQQRPVDEILVTAGEISRPVFRRLLSDAAEVGASVKVIPSMGELLAVGGAVASPNSLRPVEIRDLLRREPVVLDDSAIEEMVRDRVVLVTGGGGSIGSEICRQILRYRPGGSSSSSVPRTPCSTSATTCSPAVRACRWSLPSPTSSMRQGCGACSKRTGPTWCSTRRPTSTCRCSSTTRARRSPTTVSVPASSQNSPRSMPSGVSSPSPRTKR
jgi:FlaA1/EpsC-like NDP-sugar epimerase